MVIVGDTDERVITGIDVVLVLGLRVEHSIACLLAACMQLGGIDGPEHGKGLDGLLLHDGLGLIEHRLHLLILAGAQGKEQEEGK